MNNDPFVLSVLPNSWWSVTWNPEMWRGIYQLNSQIKLLNLLFEDLKCYEVGFHVVKHFDTAQAQKIIYVTNTIYWQQGSVETVGRYLLQEYVIEGVCFNKKQQADDFKTWLEQRYLVKLLKHNYDDNQTDW